VLDYRDGQRTLREYVASIAPLELHRVHLERRRAFGPVLRRAHQRVFPGTPVPDGFPPVVDTASHCGFLQFPGFIGCALVTALAQPDQPSILSLSGAAVPHNNMMQKMGFRLFENDVRIFSNAQGARVGYAEPRNPLKLTVLPKWKPGEEAGAAFVGGLERFVQRHGRDARLRDFPDQIAHVNRALWPFYFAGELRRRMPSLDQIPLEDLAVELLIALIDAKDGLIPRAVFDPAVRATALTAFDGIWGCWSADKGSHLFWGITDGRLVRLRVEGDELVSAEAGMRLPLTPDAILEALRAKTICPSDMLSFGVLAFYLGLQCVGGLRQLAYLPAMQQAWLALAQAHQPSEADAIEAVESTTWGGGSWSSFYADRARWGLEVVATGGISEEVLAHWQDQRLGELLARERRLVKGEPMTDADRCPRCDALQAADVAVRMRDAPDLGA
jgi:hypothetical protein